MGYERESLVKHPRWGFYVQRGDKRSYLLSARRAVVVSLLIVLSLVTFHFTFNHFNHPPHNLPHAAPPTLIYKRESISWTPCGTLDGHELECSNITVPMDHFNSTNNAPDDKSFTIPLLRMRSKNANTTTNLLLNPGGPGGSGTAFVHVRGALLSTMLGDAFHLVGFDPRGVNQSVPLASCYPSAEARQELSPVRAKKVVEDSGELWAWSRNLAQACADTMGPHAAYINTPQTAADMNLILDALGQRDLYYWGLSYGSLLGQTYATMFPERAKRVVIDGVMNQFDWYEKLLDWEMMVDTDELFAGFLSECIKAGSEDCALAEEAETEEELFELLVNEVGKLRDDPTSVYLGSSVHGVLDFWEVWFRGIFLGLYRPANWQELAKNLALLLRGNATEAFLAYGQQPWATSSDSLNLISHNDGTSGPANWPTDRTGLVEQLLSYFNNQSLFNGFFYDFFFAKQAWTIPRTHPYVPQRRVKTAHPLLILSTTYDPVCPLVSARSANDVFEGSRIVEVKGYGHCSLALPSMCVTQHVREYLTEGKLPSENVQCEPDGKPYFSNPQETMASLEARSFQDAEGIIRLAQLELARDPVLWPW
ncbi:Carboxylesterase B [Madurella mycetomatis]|uniref:Carboxylesterase B n=1 Tax=Madurella mycetomatis TaxID=100816 RepID=A0A175WA31_9PEZI|nr:Carboxylesterase B [Madurella mycetomatis]